MKKNAELEKGIEITAKCNAGASIAYAILRLADVIENVLWEINGTISSKDGN